MLNHQQINKHSILLVFNLLLSYGLFAQQTSVLSSGNGFKQNGTVIPPGMSEIAFTYNHNSVSSWRGSNAVIVIDGKNVGTIRYDYRSSITYSVIVANGEHKIEISEGSLKNVINIISENNRTHISIDSIYSLYAFVTKITPLSDILEYQANGRVTIRSDSKNQNIFRGSFVGSSTLLNDILIFGDGMGFTCPFPSERERLLYENKREFFRYSFTETVILFEYYEKDNNNIIGVDKMEYTLVDNVLILKYLGEEVGRYEYSPGIFDYFNFTSLF
jgi:hypothetical protein